MLILLNIIFYALVIVIGYFLMAMTVWMMLSNGGHKIGSAKEQKEVMLASWGWPVTLIALPILVVVMIIKEFNTR